MLEKTPDQWPHWVTREWSCHPAHSIWVFSASLHLFVIVQPLLSPASLGVRGMCTPALGECMARAPPRGCLAFICLPCAQCDLVPVGVAPGANMPVVCDPTSAGRQVGLGLGSKGAVSPSSAAPLVIFLESPMAFAGIPLCG